MNEVAEVALCASLRRGLDMIRRGMKRIMASKGISLINCALLKYYAHASPQSNSSLHLVALMFVFLCSTTPPMSARSDQLSTRSRMAASILIAMLEAFTWTVFSVSEGNDLA